MPLFLLFHSHTITNFVDLWIVLNDWNQVLKLIDFWFCCLTNGELHYCLFYLFNEFAFYVGLFSIRSGPKKDRGSAWTGLIYFGSGIGLALELDRSSVRSLSGPARPADQIVDRSSAQHLFFFTFVIFGIWKRRRLSKPRRWEGWNWSRPQSSPVIAQNRSTLL